MLERRTAQYVRGLVQGRPFGQFFVALVSDANYRSGGLWYQDAAFTTPATDNWPRLRAALDEADGRPLYVEPGSYYLNNAGADEKTPDILDGVSVDLRCTGDDLAHFRARMVGLPRVSGGTSSPITRNVLVIENAARVRLRGVLFDGGDDLAQATSGENDVDRTYRASMLEIRSCTLVELDNVRTQRGRVVTSALDYGTAGEDAIETYRSGPVFIRDCARVVGRGCGFGDDHRGEGWQVLNCDVVDFDAFHSDAPSVWTPLNVRGTESVIRIRATVENNDGSAIGVGGQDAHISVDLTSRYAGGVNLGRYLATDVRGFRTADVVIRGVDQGDRSHGFGVKLDPGALARAWDAVNSRFDYPYGELRVRGAVKGCLFGVYASHCESVDVDLLVHDAVDGSALHNAHAGQAGAGLYVQDCGAVKLRGTVRGDRTLSVTGTLGTADCAPLYGWLAVDCEHVDEAVHVQGGAFASARGNTGGCAVSTLDGRAATGDRHFRTLRLGGRLVDCIGYFGEAAQKLQAVQFAPDYLRHAAADGANYAGRDVLTVNAYQVFPIGLTAYTLTGAAQGVASGNPSRPTLDTLAAGLLDDLDTGNRALRPRQRGLYLVRAAITLATVPANTEIELTIRKNGVQYGLPLARLVVGAGPVTVSGAAVVPIDAPGTDYVNAWIEQTNGGAAGASLTDARLEAVPLAGVV